MSSPLKASWHEQVQPSDGRESVNEIDDVLGATDDEAFDRILATFREHLFEAKNEATRFAQENSQRLENWLVLRANGDLDDDELRSLIRSQKLLAEQFLNSQEIADRARLEKLTIGLLDTVMDKFLGKLF